MTTGVLYSGEVAALGVPLELAVDLARRRRGLSASTAATYEATPDDAGGWSVALDVGGSVTRYAVSSVGVVTDAD